MKELRTVTLTLMVTPTKAKELTKALKHFDGNKSDFLREALDAKLDSLLKK